MIFKGVKIGILVFVGVFLLVFENSAQDALAESHLRVSLRAIGHQVLLNSGDSTSLVLPIEKENGKYRLRFESGFGFQPEELIETVNRIVEKTEIAESYIVEVEQCETNRIVYGFEKIDSLQMTCQERTMPESCYNLLFTLINPQTPEKLRRTDAREQSFNLPGFVNRTFPFLFLLIVSMGGAAVYFLRSGNATPINPNIFPLGEFRFDKRKSVLLFQEQTIELSGKEAALLTLLSDAVNTTVKREVILNAVWGDEGDYVGRTPDVFISKLRKKLQADPNVRIINIRGIGYRLVQGE